MSYYILKICLKHLDEETQQKYREVIKNYNDNQSEFSDSGFDLFIPNDIESSECVKVDHKVQCAVYKYNNKTNSFIPTGYYMYPRSSISKTPYMLANSVGIIDSAYRGNLIAKFNCVRHLDFDNLTNNLMLTFSKHNRVCQICNPLLEPFKYIEIVDSLNETWRGAGGFGSTGK